MPLLQPRYQIHLPASGSRWLHLLRLFLSEINILQNLKEHEQFNDQSRYGSLIAYKYPHNGHNHPHSNIFKRKEEREKNRDKERRKRNKISIVRQELCRVQEPSTAAHSLASAWILNRRKELGRITLYKRSGADPLVDGLEVNNKGWKNGFFFVEKSSLGEAGQNLRDGWNVKDLRLDLVRSGTRNLELQDKLLATPSELRSYSNYLGSPSLAVIATHSFDSSMATDKGNKVLSREESKKTLLKRKRGNSPNSSEVQLVRQVLQNVGGSFTSTKH